MSAVSIEREGAGDDAFGRAAHGKTRRNNSSGKIRGGFANIAGEFLSAHHRKPSQSPEFPGNQRRCAMAPDIPDNPDALLTREQTAAALSAIGASDKLSFSY